MTPSTLIAIGWFCTGMAFFTGFLVHPILGILFAVLAMLFKTVGLVLMRRGK